LVGTGGAVAAFERCTLKDNLRTKLVLQVTNGTASSALVQRCTFADEAVSNNTRMEGHSTLYVDASLPPFDAGAGSGEVLPLSRAPAIFLTASDPTFVNVQQVRHASPARVRGVGACMHVQHARLHSARSPRSMAAASHVNAGHAKAIVNLIYVCLMMHPTAASGGCARMPQRRRRMTYCMLGTQMPTLNCTSHT
jgi:hypothetical protein